MITPATPSNRSRSSAASAHLRHGGRMMTSARALAARPSGVKAVKVAHTRPPKGNGPIGVARICTLASARGATNACPGSRSIARLGVSETASKKTWRVSAPAW